jgi:hypothetical protein
MQVVIRITGCDILPDGKFVFAEQEGKRLLMFSNYGNYEKDIVGFQVSRLRFHTQEKTL